MNGTEIKEIDLTELFKQPEITKELTKLAEARFADFAKTYKPDAVLTKDKATEERAAHMAESMSLTGTFKEAVGDIVPVAGGMVVGVFVTEFVDGALAKYSVKMRGGIEIAASIGALYAAHKYGNKVPLLGKKGLTVIALLVAFDGIRKIVPIDTWGGNMASKVTGAFPTAGLLQASHYTPKTVAATRSPYAGTGIGG